MTLIDRYIAKTVLGAIALVTLLLSGLQIFILFVSQLDNIGKANYGILQAGLFVMLQLPYQVYLFFPMASLLGCLIGLGVMANHRELVVMRAAGLSIGQVTMAVMKAAMVVVIVVTFLGETVVPKVVRFSNDEKMQALNNGQSLRTEKGLWLRYQNDFISIGAIKPNLVLLQVHQFQFDETHHLHLVRKIEKLHYVNGVWQAQGIHETIIDGNRTKARYVNELIWEIPLKPKLLGISQTEPDEMTLHELRHYLHDQKIDRQASYQYQLTFLQRVIQPITTMVMMVLAIPFIFGPLRSSTMGSKLVAGISVGFGFYIINRFLGPMSQVLQWPPQIAAFGPTCFFGLLGLYLMSKVRQ